MKIRRGKHERKLLKTDDLLNIKEENPEFKIKCESCNFVSESLEILNFHMFSHEMKPSEIFQKLPPELTNYNFETKQDFQKALQNFLSQNQNLPNKQDPVDA